MDSCCRHFKTETKSDLTFLWKLKTILDTALYCDGFEVLGVSKGMHRFKTSGKRKSADHWVIHGLH